MKTTSRLPLAMRTAQKRVGAYRAATRASRTSRKGFALLSVLWLAAALSAIAFTVANLVRAETERALTEKDAVRAYYLAAGAVDRAMLYIQWGPGYRNPDGSPKYFQPPMPVIRFDFPTGSAAVEVIPENSKLNVNTAPAQELRNLLLALGVDPTRATAVAAGILDWRTPSPGRIVHGIRSALFVPDSVFSIAPFVFSRD